MERAFNALVSTQKSDSDLQIALHPLVLLTISDHITRHHARQQTNPIVGALLGRQKQERRETTLEQVFECRLIQGANGEWSLHQAWFDERLKQFKDVHKDPQLDLMGWFTNTPPAGPAPNVLPVHRQILSANDSAVLLAFHPSLINEPSSAGKLPLTIYESIFEEGVVDLMDADEMQDEAASPKIVFREIPYSIETGEAEMISVDFVARGGASAAVVGSLPSHQTKPRPAESLAEDSNQRDKSESQTNGVNTENPLSPAEEDLIASLTARLNATRMLQSRISILKSYLARLPPSALNNHIEPPASDSSGSNTLTTSYPILRSISALVSRLALLNPASVDIFDTESAAEKNDVNLINLLGSVGQSLGEAREVGKKFSVTESGKQNKKTGGGHTAGNSGMEGLRGSVDDMFPQGQSAGLKDVVPAAWR